MQRLPAGCGAHVDHMISRLRVCQFSHQHGAHVLYHEQPFPEALQAFQMIIAGNQKCIGQVRMRLCIHSFPEQSAFQFFRGDTVQAAPDRDRLLLLKICQHSLNNVLIIVFLPQLYDPLRAGISHGQRPNSLLGIFHISKPSCHAAEHPVYISLETRKPFPRRQLHSLAAHRPVRHAVHVFHLVDRAAEHAPDDRFHLLYFDL